MVAGAPARALSRRIDLLSTLRRRSSSLICSSGSWLLCTATAWIRSFSLSLQASWCFKRIFFSFRMMTRLFTDDVSGPICNWCVLAPVIQWRNGLHARAPIRRFLAPKNVDIPHRLHTHTQHLWMYSMRESDSERGGTKRFFFLYIPQGP